MTATKTKIKKSEEAKLTEDQKNILKYLVEYQSLTTSQLWQEVNPEKELRSIRRDLDKLKMHKMVKSFQISSIRAGRKENCWQLLKMGAVAIDANFDDRYSRQPSPEKMKAIAQELELKRQVIQLAGWQLIKPQNYNSVNPKPEKTAQYTLIVEAYRFALLTNLQERKKNNPGELGLNEEVKAFNAGMYRSIPPKEANDWLAYLDLYNSQNQLVKKLVVILILCKDDHTLKFWNQRCEQYAKTAEKLYVAGIFPSPEDSQTYKDLLTENNLKVTNINSLSRFLNSIKERNVAK